MRNNCCRYSDTSKNTDEAFWQHVWQPEAGNKKLGWFCTWRAFRIVANIKYVSARHHTQDQWTGRERYYFSTRFAFWLAPDLNGIEKEKMGKRRGCNIQIEMVLWKTCTSRSGVWSQPKVQVRRHSSSLEAWRGFNQREHSARVSLCLSHLAHI